MLGRPRDDEALRRPRKRPRTSTPQEPQQLRSTVLSAFFIDENEAESCIREKEAVRNVTRDLRNLSAVQVREQVDALLCISESDGKKRAEHLAESVRTMKASLAEAANALLDGDGLGDMDSGPPLCTIAYLLRRGGVFRLDDLSISSLRARATLEIEPENSCGCTERTGLEQLMEVVFENEDKNARRSEFLTELMRVYNMPAYQRTKPDFLLAWRTADYLLECGVIRLDIEEVVDSWVGASLTIPRESAIVDADPKAGEEVVRTIQRECPFRDLLRFRVCF
eukprot:Plantae.Rhodophyta-Hildenbrandia_rubra.ctg31995.p2 GENE.Plantae.Rhodophyta-Hildenbrandia_rubra.ctg31995~~Plantae.Rhodophyta-Hildenbrandia_rubra.ctg31995.p2  ORF type:complete len:281 (+),score=45.59 Plantae.Rhodophyta-Hildenbrandia_rubra.ctg31995:3199-4041(+)